jgi:N-acetylglucosaminyldiphosphoundecaprenol N-acetyl-beta-D-mannosaminyltransferase
LPGDHEGPVSTRFRLGEVSVDVVDLQGALDSIERLVNAGAGGAIFTPNVDHVVNARRLPALARAYAQADLSLADGMPVVWASRLMGSPLPERVAGSDLVGPLLARAASRGWRVYLLGGRPGAAEEAGRRLGREGATVVGTDGARVGADGAASDEVLERIVGARPELLLVGLGSPKQELFIDRHRPRLGRTVAFACGAVIDFLAGQLPRAPRWMSRAGLEWAYRLAREPRRLWRRYLVEDPAFLAILLDSWRSRRRPEA